VNIEDLRLSIDLDPGFREHRHELLTERSELLWQSQISLTSRSPSVPKQT